MNKSIEQHYDEIGELHRVGGPAITYSDGAKLWLRHGKFHRRGGPAAVFPGEVRSWYVNGYGLRTPRGLPERVHGIMELFL